MFIINANEPPLGEILRDIRVSKDMSQEETADLAQIHRTTLSDIETGKIPCSSKNLRAIKKALGVEELPLLKTERSHFRDMMFGWNHEISEGNFETAKILRERFSVIKRLSHVKDLNIWFSVFDCRLSIALREMEAAGEILNEQDETFESFSDFQQYYYFFNKGNYCGIKTKKDNRYLDFYLKAYALEENGGIEKHINLYLNISNAYKTKGFVTLSITFLEEACTLVSDKHSIEFKIELYNDLGVDYIDTNILQRAKKILLKALSLANKNYKSNPNNKNGILLGRVLLNAGYLFRKAKIYIKAIDLLNLAIPHLINDKIRHMEAMYQKAHAFVETEDCLSATEIINEGIKLSKGNEVYTIMFEELNTLMYPGVDNVKHMHKVVLPYMLENDYVHLALDYATFLRNHYESKNYVSEKKVLEMSDVIYTIQNKMYEGSVIEWEKDSFDI